METNLVLISKTELQTMLNNAVKSAEQQMVSEPKSDVPIKLLSINDLCQFFRVSRVTIHKWMKDGRIPYRKVNRRVYFILEEVLNSINKFDFKTVASAKESILNGRGR